MKNKTGFTLVEMLTVVIIVGILAAVAVPQYRRAIQKAQVTETIAMLRSIHDSEERLATMLGYKTFSAMATAQDKRAVFTNLDIFDSETFPCTIEDTTITCEAFTYTLNPTGDYIVATKRNNPYQNTQIRFYRRDVPRITCVGEQDACDTYNLDREEPGSGDPVDPVDPEDPDELLED